MKTVSSSTSRRLFYKLPLRNFEKVIDQQANKLTELIVGSATSFLVSQKYQIKEPKVGGITTLKLPEKR